jgi:hypothetical protein
MKTNRRYILLHALLCGAVGISCTVAASAQPFSASTTYRKSIKKDINGNVSLLTQDSKDLAFQDYPYLADGKLTYDPRYLAFATKDSTIDDLSPAPNGRCTGTDFFQVYWIDDYNDSIRCVSADIEQSGQGTEDSFNPKIGGPTDDEGRYIAFESKAKNLYRGKDGQPTPPPSPPGDPPPPTYTPTTQVVVHDRKFEHVWLSTSKNKDECRIGPNASVNLDGLGDDGAKILFTSKASNLFNNVEPQCVPRATFNNSNVLIRDGANCDQPAQTGNATGLGECQTSVLTDTFELHAAPDLVSGLDADASHAAMNGDSSVVVFDSQATVPTHFNPDISGHYDVYYWKNQKFSVISRAQVPRCSISGTLLPIKNDNDPADDDSQFPRVDGAGRYVVYQSKATDLVVDTTNANMVCSENGGAIKYYPHPKSFSYVSTGGVSQIYLYDSVNKTTQLVSKANGSSGGANGASAHPWISRDAHYIIYESAATNLLSTSTTAHRNIFLYDRVQNKTYLVTPGNGGTGLSQDATITQVSNNGLTVAFQTTATDVAPNNSANGTIDPASTIRHVYLAQNSCPLDTDGDGVPDCLDLCSNDITKTEPQACGCGKPDTDTDGDLIADCVDSCPNDNKKTAAGQCGCGVLETDTDGDGAANCVDTCPTDSSKTSAGRCGCGVAETDSDSDGTPNCADACPTNPAKTSSGACACSDLKDTPGQCGCNVADTDANGNGAADCLDPTASTQPSLPRVDLTRTTADNQAAKYQMFVIAQKFRGRVSYSFSLSGKNVKVTKTNTGGVAVFNDLPKGTYSVKYTVSVGLGASKVTSKQTSAKVSVPKGTVTAASK